MALKGRKPALVEPGKPKFMVSGKFGLGKTYFACCFPNVYFMDTEGGAVRKQYKEKLIKGSGAYFGKDDGSQDFYTVIKEIKALTIEKHEYKTLVIDSFSKLYNIASAIAEAEGGSEFGRDKREANKPTRQLMLALEKLDMNVILICHSKDKWSRQGKEITCDGTSYDGYDKMEGDLDLWLEIFMIGKLRQFVVKKTRIESFPMGATFPATYEEFSKRYGKEIIEKEQVPIVLATQEECNELRNLINSVKIEDSMLKKWYSNAGTDVIEEMPIEIVQKGIMWFKKKLEGKENEK